MRAIYLIARREYLSYVATWGFWLSLASVPLFMILGGGLPVLIESSQPTRFYTLVDETGRYEAAIFDRLGEARMAQRAEVQEAVAEMMGEDMAAQAMAQQPDNDDRFIPVPPPGRTIDALRPYLLGERLLDIAEPPQPLFAAIFIRDGPDGGVVMEYWSENLASSELRGDIRRALRDQMREDRLRQEGVAPDVLSIVEALNPDVTDLNPERGGAEAEVTIADRAPIFIGVAFAFVLWTVVFSVVNMLLTAMIEEKGNKVLESLLASARYHEILVGKLLGVAAVSFTLLLFWGALGTGMVVLGGQLLAQLDSELPAVLGAIADPGLILAALGYFVIGYLMFGSLFLAVGSLCETLQEAQTLMGPIFLIMMVPLFIVMVSAESPDSPVVQIASWVPFWTPFVMLARLPSEPAAIELLATTGVMIATAVIIIWGAGAVFRMGALNHANADTVKSWFRFGKKKSA